MIEEIDFVPDRLNEEPVLMLGMTHTEFKSVGFATVLFWVPVALIVCGLLGQALMGLAVGSLLALGTSYQIGKILRKLKRGKPKGYHVAIINGWLEDHGLKQKTMIRHSQSWGIRRSIHKKIGDGYDGVGL
jgi:conjugative transfer region protein (TIGR03750 family)